MDYIPCNTLTLRVNNSEGKTELNLELYNLDLIGCPFKHQGSNDSSNEIVAFKNVSVLSEPRSSS